MKTTPRVGKVVASIREGRFRLDDHHQQGQIIRIDSGEIRKRPLNARRPLGERRSRDQVAAASLIPETEAAGPQEDLPLQ